MTWSVFYRNLRTPENCHLLLVFFIRGKFIFFILFNGNLIMILDLETSLRKTNYKIFDRNNNLIDSGSIVNLNSVSRVDGDKMSNLYCELLGLKELYNPEIVVYSVLGKRIRSTEKVLSMVRIIFNDVLCVEV